MGKQFQLDSNDRLDKDPTLVDPRLNLWHQVLFDVTAWSRNDLGHSLHWVNLNLVARSICLRGTRGSGLLRRRF